MKLFFYILISTFCLFAISSCSTVHKTVEPTARNVWNGGESVYSHCSLRLSLPGENIDLSGTLKMRRNELVQLNLTYIFGIQVGVIEFTVDSVLLMSKATHQYAKADYDEFSKILGRQVTFEKFQDFFWGEGQAVQEDGITMKYDGKQSVEDARQIPTSYLINVESPSMPISVVLSTSQARLFDNSRLSTTMVSGDKYCRLTLSQVLQMIMSMLNK